MTSLARLGVLEYSLQIAA